MIDSHSLVYYAIGHEAIITGLYGLGNDSGK